MDFNFDSSYFLVQNFFRGSLYGFLYNNTTNKLNVYKIYIYYSNKYIYIYSKFWDNDPSFSWVMFQGLISIDRIQGLSGFAEDYIQN